MTHPEADPADLAEQADLAATGAPALRPGSLPDDAPEADVLEQAAEAGPGARRVREDVPLEADELDAAEQAVQLDDDDEHR